MHYRERTIGVKGEALGTAFAIMIALMSAAACSGTNGDEVDRRVAESFLRNSPTFRFDGLPDSVDLLGVAAGDCGACRKFTFGFESSHPGYGDRSTMTLDGAVTQHKAMITIEDGPRDSSENRQRLGRAHATSSRTSSSRDAWNLPPSLRRPGLPVRAPRRTGGGRPIRGSHDHVRRCAGGLAVPRVHQLRRIRSREGARRRDCRGRQLGLHEIVLRQRTVGRGTVQSVGQYVLSMRELYPYPGSGDTRYAAIFVVSKVIAA